MRALCFIVGAAAATVLAGGCAVEPEVAVAANTQTLQSCPKNTCGDPNSPVIDGVYFWRLHAGGLENEDGVRITAVHKGGVPLSLDVYGDDLRGMLGGAVHVQGTTLPGTRIQVSVKGRPYEIRVRWAVPNQYFWVGSKTWIWAYKFTYVPLFDDGTGDRSERPLCAEGDSDPTSVDALVFEGDLYDPVTKKIAVGPATAGWFNIACFDSAIYKMHKIGHTTVGATRAGSPLPSVNQRRAMLNAWTSNVCGDGSSYTDAGVLIRLRDSLDIVPSDSGYFFNPATTAPARFEAIWNENGAVCLTKHRLDGTPGEKNIPCRGALPLCDTMVGDWETRGHVVTSLPLPAP